MSTSLEQAIHQRRLILQNPYAHMDELEEIKALKNAHRALENPQAYAAELEELNLPVLRFDNLNVERAVPSIQAVALFAPAPASVPKADAEISKFVSQLHRRIWKHRANLFSDYRTRDPIDMLDPIIALEFLGYKVEIGGALGQMEESDRPARNIAGLIDMSSRQVLLSSGFSPAIRRFTAAHEAGHAVMHKLSGMHRDKSMDGSLNRDHIEQEADKFAAFFLMPEKLLKRVFEETFGAAPFVLDEENRFALSGSMPHQQWQPRRLRDLSRLLSAATRFNGVSIVALSDRFQVSVEAMAIRLEQLQLISMTLR